MDYLSDASIMAFLNTLKAEYFLVSSFVLLVLGSIVVKTKNTWDDKLFQWLKLKFKRGA